MFGKKVLKMKVHQFFQPEFSCIEGLHDHEIHEKEFNSLVGERYGFILSRHGCQHVIVQALSWCIWTVFRSSLSCRRYEGVKNPFEYWKKN